MGYCARHCKIMTLCHLFALLISHYEFRSEVLARIFVVSRLRYAAQDSADIRNKEAIPQMISECETFKHALDSWTSFFYWKRHRATSKIGCSGHYEVAKLLQTEGFPAL